MKIWTKLGLAALTLGVIAALVLTGGGAPRALAEHVTCAEWQQTCVEYAVSVECEDYPELCYAECIIEGAYIDDGMDCGACAQLDILIARHVQLHRRNALQLERLSIFRPARSGNHFRRARIDKRGDQCAAESASRSGD